jgi:hypothetical protein
MEAYANFFEQMFILMIQLLFFSLNSKIRVKDVLFKPLTPLNNAVTIDASNKNTDTGDFFGFNKLKDAFGSGFRNAVVICINNKVMKISELVIDWEIDFLLFIVPERFFREVGSEVLDLVVHEGDMMYGPGLVLGIV